MQKQKNRNTDVVHSEKEFEIRFYPSAILATVYSDASSYRELAYPGFRKLAGYIFGGNESETKISMTSPVHMDMNTASMSFVMPSSFSEENLPKPDDPGVKIERTDDVYVAAIRFSGYASDKDIRKYSEKLKTLPGDKRDQMVRQLQVSRIQSALPALRPKKRDYRECRMEGRKVKEFASADTPDCRTRSCTGLIPTASPDQICATMQS
ncbi:MAG: heme-binding protein [Marinilabiliales bacterium]|nr:heme-binding protein [Marinilabiliales bacterium]